jgi:hypothetical protein
MIASPCLPSSLVAQCGGTRGLEMSPGWNHRWVRRRVAVERVVNEK